MTSKPPRTVRTRRVHYISGFDPRGVRFYHRLYREEAARQIKLSGAVLEVGKRRRCGTHVVGWDVTGTWDGQRVDTDYQFMAWDDVVREHWDRLLGPVSLFIYLKYFLMGGAVRVARASRNAFFNSLHPLYCVLVLVLLSLSWVILGGWIAWMVTGNWLVAAGISAVLLCFLIPKGLKVANQEGALWLLRSCIFTLIWGNRPYPDLESRIDEMAGHILREQQIKPVDEVLIVGHSSGSMVSLSVVARILEKEPSPTALESLHYITLGQCIPYIGVMPKAKAFRRDISTVAADSRIAWTDFTALKDIMCFFKVNPIEASGLSPVAENRPRRLVVRIYRMFSRKTYSQLLRNKMRLHFQYVMASEVATDYDYFFITAGPRALREQGKDSEILNTTTP